LVKGIDASVDMRFEEDLACICLTLSKVRKDFKYQRRTASEMNSEKVLIQQWVLKTVGRVRFVRKCQSFHHNSF